MATALQEKSDAEELNNNGQEHPEELHAMWGAAIQVSYDREDLLARYKKIALGHKNGEWARATAAVILDPSLYSQVDQEMISPY